MSINGFLAVSVHAGLSLCVFNIMHNAQPAAYMDEIFHIPQARKYCYGKFDEWDDKITTLPGLYLVSVGILNPISFLVQRIVCDPWHLRLINTVLSSICLLVLQRIIVQIHGAKHYYNDAKCLLSAFNMAVFPLFYFFSFLYYTDIGSTFMFLLMYCLHLDRRDWFASFIGLLAVLFRQTNIIWVAFVAAQSIGPYFIHTIHCAQIEQTNQQTPARFSLTTTGQFWEIIEGLYRIIVVEPQRGLKLMKKVLNVAGGYLLVGISFVIFVIINDGIVVGDRSSHVATFHPIQILYFIAFTTAFTVPYVLSKSKFIAFWNFCRKHWIAAVIFILMIVTTIDSYGSIAHKFLLADNRHYTFYIWRKIIARKEPWSKFLLIPVYFYGGFCCCHSIRKTNIIFKLSYVVFVFLNLCPQLLLEFRYFVIPYFMYRLQVRPTNWTKLVLETILYQSVNAITIYLFVMKPFTWENEPEQTQRFMW